MNLKKIINSGFKFLTDSDFRFLYLARQGKYDHMPDDEYLKRMFKAKMGKELDLENPKTFNEKLQWLKLNDRKPIYTTMVDKIDAKKYVADIIGEEYIIPTLGTWNSPDEIDFDKLPNQFVLKCNHNSGCGMFICREKSSFEIGKAKAELAKGLKEDYYLTTREWPYKDVKRRVIAEKFIGEDLIDYRFYCFNGHPKYVYMYLNDSKDNNGKPEPEHCNIYDMNWDLQQFHQKSLPTKKEYEKPKQFENMKMFAEKLSAGTRFLRVDFYFTNGQILFGEMTFYPGTGFSKFEPAEWDEKVGALLNIDNIK